MNAPRVLHVITGLDGGGAERFLAALLPRLGDGPRSCAVLTLQGPGVAQGPLEEAGVPVHNMGARRGLPPGPLAFWRARRMIRAWKPAVVCGWMYHGDMAARYARRVAGPGTALVWGIHQTPARPEDERWLTRRVIAWCRGHSREADRIVYVSRRSREAHAAAGFFDGRAVVVPNGFDLARFAPPPTAEERAAAREEVRAELGLEVDAPLILRVARVDPMKDHPLLLEAFLAVHAARADAALALAGVGADADAPVFAAWRREHPAAAARVRWLGWREDMARLAAAADVAASSSAMKEAFPLVLGEAMACATPCVTTDVGDAAWLVGDTGRVVAPGSAEALAEALLSLLNMPEAQRRELGSRARARVAENFSLEAAASAYARVLDEAADRARGKMETSH